MNNPVNNSDSSGNLSIPNWAKVVIGVAGLAVAVAIISTTTPLSIGLIKTLIHGAVTSGLYSSVTRASCTTIISLANGDNVKTILNNVANSAVSGFCDGFTWGGVSAGASRDWDIYQIKLKSLAETSTITKPMYFYMENKI